MQCPVIVIESYQCVPLLKCSYFYHQLLFVRGFLYNLNLKNIVSVGNQKFSEVLSFMRTNYTPFPAHVFFISQFMLDK